MYNGFDHMSSVRLLVRQLVTAFWSPFSYVSVWYPSDGVPEN